MAATASTSRVPSKVAQSLLVWLAALTPTLPSLYNEVGDDGGDSSTSGRRRVVEKLDDLSDGVVLSEILGELDPAYFRPLLPSTSSSRYAALAENHILRFQNLKRAYKLVIRYFEDVLHANTSTLPAPNLLLIAKGGNSPEVEDEICRLSGLVLALTVQSDKRQQHVERIQSFDEWVQRELKWSIEQVMSKVTTKSDKDKNPSAGADADSEFYDLQHERSRLLTEKETVQVVYEELVQSYQTLKSDHEEALSSLKAAESRVSDLEASQKDGKSARADVTFKADFDRLRADLQKAENELGESEVIVDRQAKMLEELTRKIDELTPRAEEAARLKDQMDEYRHAAERAKKTEAVIEKYKKKLEESADLRRLVKTVEEQNSDLLDKNAALEEEYRKVSAFKPLMESYKSQLDTHERRASDLAKENDALKHELQRAKRKLQAAEEEREKDAETLKMFEDRVAELEHGRPNKRNGKGASVDDGTVDDEEGEFEGVGGELDDAISGTTMTDLKLQVRKLRRELEAATANKADSSRIVVLENLLEDANRMKKRYESDYLKEHREKLVAESKLDEILNGKAKYGDGPEATIAVRMRLNETVEQLEAERKAHAALDVRFNAMNKELTIAKSDLNLVNKDQLDVLKSLRASVSVEKDELVKQVDDLKAKLRSIEDKSKMQMSQINSLLLEKVSLQSDGIGQREKMLDRERDLGDLKASLSGKSLSEEDRRRFATLEEEHAKAQTELQEMRGKLSKAKAFIKQQDRLFKEAHASEHHGDFDEAEQSYRSQIATLKEELDRQKTNSAEIEARYRREHQLMLSAWHDLGMRHMREMVVNSATRSGPSSWLAQQRAKAKGPSYTRSP